MNENLEQVIENTVELSKIVLKQPKYIPIYNLIVTGISCKYGKDRNDIIKMLYAQSQKNNFYFGLEDNG